MADAKNKALWHGRFTHAPSSELMDFTASIDIDRRLAPEDIEGSRAHVRMLGNHQVDNQIDSGHQYQRTG